jgi:hypothetical protein
VRGHVHQPHPRSEPVGRRSARLIGSCRSRDHRIAEVLPEPEILTLERAIRCRKEVGFA